MLLEIIKNDENSIKQFHDQGWGRSNEVITQEQLKALLEGGALGYFDGEYTAVFTLEKK